LSRLTNNVELLDRAWLSNFGGRISENPNEAARRSLGADECVAVDVGGTFQAIVKRVLGFLDADRFGSTY
jgi:hypothetical protein